MTVPVIETARLRLEPMSDDHAPRVQVFFNHWDVVKFLPRSVPWPYPDNGAEGFIRHVALPGMARGDEWVWAIVEKAYAEDGAIGCVHLRRRSPEGHIGFWLGKPWHGNGYMSEAVNAVCAHAFEVLDFDSMQTLNAAENHASGRVQQKTGARLVETRTVDIYHGGFPQEQVWELTRDLWRSAKKTG
jgi:RimJ/RimL family protein N-acetyltransferase